MGSKEIFSRWKPGFTNFAVGVSETIAATVATYGLYAMRIQDALTWQSKFAPGGRIPAENIGNPEFIASVAMESHARSMQNTLNPFQVDNPVTPFLQIVAPLFVGIAETAAKPTHTPESKFVQAIRKVHFQLAMITTSLAVPVLTEWLHRGYESIMFNTPANITGFEASVVFYAIGSVLRAKGIYSRSNTREYKAVNPAHTRKADPSASFEMPDIWNDPVTNAPIRESPNQTADRYVAYINDMVQYLEYNGWNYGNALENARQLAVRSLIHESRGVSVFSQSQFKPAFDFIETVETELRHLGVPLGATMLREEMILPDPVDESVIEAHRQLQEHVVDGTIIEPPLRGVIPNSPKEVDHDHKWKK